jgi:hypothetical protein
MGEAGFAVGVGYGTLLYLGSLGQSAGVRPAESKPIVPFIRDYKPERVPETEPPNRRADAPLPTRKPSRRPGASPCARSSTARVHAAELLVRALDIHRELDDLCMQAATLKFLVET